MKLHDICHVELRTRDAAAARAFYASIFDWRFADFMPGYWGIDTGAWPGGGMLQTPNAHVPTGLCNYVLVEDCEAMGRRTSELGGKVVVQKTEIPNAGSFVNAIDPWGNELGYWQAAQAREPKFTGSGKNGFCWVELAAPKLDLAVDYYQKLLDWKLQFAPDMQYAWTEHSGEQIGIGIAGGEMAKHMKGVTTYIDVDDLAESQAKVVAAGGKVLFGPQEIPGTGTFTLFTDLDGTRLALFKHKDKK